MPDDPSQQAEAGLCLEFANAQTGGPEIVTFLERQRSGITHLKGSSLVY